MKTLLALVLYFSLPLFVKSVNFKNNACPKLAQYHFAPFNKNCYVNPDVMSDMSHMVARNGYDLNTHNLVTDDGYFLTLFEVSKNPTKKYSLFVLHGLSSNANAMVDLKERSLAFYFASLGYRVFLGNVRGSTYSRKHKTMNINNGLYWNFTLDTVAENDVFTMLSFVYNHTGQKIHYVGYSMGTTLSFMFMVTFPEETSKWIQSVALLAPVVYVDGVPLFSLAKTALLVALWALRTFHINGILYQEKLIHSLLVTVSRLLPEATAALIQLAGRTLNVPSNDLLLFPSYWPSGISTNQLEHYYQIANTKKFSKFDFGPKGNKKQYGTSIPPLYDLSKVHVPISLFYGVNDFSYLEKNMERLFNEIGSIDKFKNAVASNISDYNHIDFLIARGLIIELYVSMTAFMQNYES